MKLNIADVNWKDWKTYVFGIPAFPFFLLYKLAQALRSRVWDHTNALGVFLHEALALVAAVMAAIHGASTIGSMTHLGSFWNSVIGFLFTELYAVPIVWIIFLKPVYDFLNWSWSKCDYAVKHYLAPLLTFPARLFSRLPGASQLWAKVSDDHWFEALLIGVSYLTAGGASLYAGWQVKEFVEQLLPSAYLAHEFVVGAACALGLLVLGFASRLLCGAVAEAKQQGVATILSAAAVYGTHGWLNAAATGLGLNGYTGYGLDIFAYIILVGFAFPALCQLFAQGFLEKMLDALGDMAGDFWGGDPSSFRHIFLQLTGVAVSGVLGLFGAGVCLNIGLGLLPVLSIGLLVAFAAYAVINAGIDSRVGNAIVASLSTVAVGAGVGSHYCAAGYLFGIFGAVACGIVAALLTGVVVLPLIFRACDRFCGLPGVRVVAKFAADKLCAMHTFAIEHVCKPVARKCEQVYNLGYDRQNEKFADFRTATVHVTNLFVSLKLGMIAFLTSLHLLHMFAPWSAIASGAVAFLFAYAIIGRVVTYADVHFTGVMAGLYAGLKVAALVLPAQSYGMVVALPVGVLTAALTYTTLFPLVLLGLRPVLNPVAPVILRVSKWANEKAWRLVHGCLDAFWKMFHFFYEVFKPVWRFFGRVLRLVGRFLNWLWSLVTALWRMISPPLRAIWTFCAAIFSSAWNACLALWKALTGGK